MTRRHSSGRISFFFGSLLATLTVACGGDTRPNDGLADAGAETDVEGSSAPGPGSSGCSGCSVSARPGPSSGSDSGETWSSEHDTEAATPEVEAVWRLAEPLFSSTHINHVFLTLDGAQEEVLRADPSAYVHGSVEVRLGDDTVITLDDVGVRLKGKWGSARNLDQKAAFLIKTNEFVPGQKLLGLSKFALNNMVQDPSMLHEQLAYLLFREMGIAAPRTGYANVTFNDELFGLYASIEVVDNESFLEHWFGSDKGNLYEGAYGSDLDEGRVHTFDRDRGQDVGFADLEAVKEALDALPEERPFMSSVGTQIDAEWFARFTATELGLAHWDGYAVTRNNYFLYPNQTGAWTFVPWGLDQTFGDSNYSLWVGDARVHRMCTNSRDCRSAMATAYSRLATLFEELDLLGRVDALERLIHDAALADPRKEYEAASIWAAIEATRQFVRARPASIASQLTCADPAAVDGDGDGVSGCGDDCDDSDPAVFPNAVETCNLVDDNCNGEVDELEECPSCFEAETSEHRYTFCVRPRTFWSAQTDCQAQGAALASLHSELEQHALLQLAAGLGLPHAYWLGFTDEQNEGQFVWLDNSGTGYTNWGGGEPNDAGGNEDCTQLTTSGAWNDLPCDAELPYVCRWE